MISFMSLPTEIQERILYYTDLVVPLRPLGLYQGLFVMDGHIVNGGLAADEDGTKWVDLPHFPSELFYVNRHISRLARSIVFAENRIIIDRNYKSYNEAVAWLEMQPQYLLDKIRHLDLAVYLSSDGGRPHSADWEGLLTNLLSLLHRLNMPNLTFSIDGANDYLEFTKEEQYYFDWLPSAYQPIVTELKSGNLQSLKAFFVFWPVYSSLEIAAEKAVMGQEYDSASHGKIAYQDRDPRLPHGWEWGYTEDEYFDPDSTYNMYMIEHSKNLLDAEPSSPKPNF